MTGAGSNGAGTSPGSLTRVTDGQELPMRVLLYRAFRTAEDQVLAQLHKSGFDDLTRAQHHLLVGLDSDGRVEVGELAHRAGIAEPTARALLARLTQAGYVVADPDDAEGVELSDRGHEVVTRTRTAESTVEQSWSDLLGAELFEQVRVGLTRLND